MKNLFQIQRSNQSRRSREIPVLRSRSAFTLVEVLAVVALTSILLSVVISLLIGLQRYDAKLRDGDVRADRIAGLAEAIRTDIRMANSVLLPTNQSLLITTSAGRQIQFDLTEEGCRRMVNDRGGAMPTTDLYRIGPSESWTLATGPPGRRTLYVVELLAKHSTKDEPARVKLLVQAALGADRFDRANKDLE
jgi:prepilin-type N-terminal cleavage/methylation domain-containing protein